MDVIHEHVLPQLEALTLERDRPLLVVDVDEVLVGLAGHLGEYAAAQGYALKLTGYKLDGALKRGDGETASDDEFRTLFRGFFETETIRQRVYADAPDVLARLSRLAQIVVLTNVPPHARECRIANLSGHSIDYPLVVNHGPKGAALAWMAGRVAAPIVFIDDSPTQIASAAELVPRVRRIHFVGDEELRAMIDPLDQADHAPASWLEIESLVAKAFDRGR